MPLRTNSKLIILNGAPGVGKSTTAQLLADSYPNSVRVKGDDIKHWIVNRESDTITKGLTYINGGLCCRSYLEAGFNLVVFEYIFTKKQDLTRFLSSFQFKEKHILITLTAPLKIIKKRELSRKNREPLGDAVDLAHKEITTNQKDLGHFIDTEFLTPNEVKQTLLTLLKTS